MGIKREVLDKKKELCNNSLNLRTIKFAGDVKRDTITKIIEEQDKVYKQWVFYKSFLKAYKKEEDRK